MQIEKGVPVPEPYKGRERKYPFPDMEVGDSFTVPLAGTQDGNGRDAAASLLRVACSHYARNHGVEFTVRTVREEGVARCWRTA